jgi:hypothetical protein
VRRALAALVAALVLTTPTAALAAEAFYPDEGPPTQVSRTLNLRDAAQRGLVKLSAKGGPPVAGDRVNLELAHKKVRGPITVTIRAEFTVKPRVSAEKQELVRQALPSYQRQLEAELNRRNYRTPAGDPLRFQPELRFRSPDAPKQPNFHQVLIVNPTIDLDEPDPSYRSRVFGLGTPNRYGEARDATFSSLSFGEPSVLAHEFLHLAGLDDQYVDVYHVNGRDYPLPSAAETKAELTRFAKSHKPPLPPPPAGKVRARNKPRVSPCDIMGTGAHRACRRLSKRDLKFFDDQAGVSVVAQPGDLLANKDQTRQNFGVGFKTTVFAAPGQTTVANGVSIYCIDKDLGPPLFETFDVLEPAGATPGYEPVARLLELSGRLQASVDEPVPGMLWAVWNVTDAVNLDTSDQPAAARALLAQAGIAENSLPQGLPHLPDPNAASPDTAALGGGGVLPPVPSQATEPPPLVTLTFARLYPARVRAGRRARADLLLSTLGEPESVELTVQRRAGRRWRRVRTLPSRKVKLSGDIVMSLRLGRLRPGRHRLVVAVGRFGQHEATRAVPFRVSG